MSHFWRAANMSYLKYVNIASALVRRAVKEPMRAKIQAQGDDVAYRTVKMTPEGKGGEKILVEGFGTKII